MPKIFKYFKYIFFIFFILFFLNSAFAIPKIDMKKNAFQESSQRGDKKKIRFIVNPISGTNNKKFILKIIHKYLDKNKYDYEIVYTKARKHATKLSLDAANLKYAAVIAIGGDGTVNEVAKGLIGSKTKMGIIPTGSGNGLARHLYISKNPLKAVNIINNFRSTKMDSIKINNEIFVSVAGIGFDAHIAEKFSKAKKRGFFSYANLILKEYFSYKPKTFEMIVDGKKVERKALLISFANGSQYGNNIQIAPNARIGDGNFEVAILKNPSFFDRFSTLLRLKNGTIDKSKYFESFKCRSLKIDQKNLLAHIDGEPVVFENGIEIKPFKKISVLVP
ncbi:MAG: Diacylglycerol kinase [Candidatus Anoxychlamydiales bacterium]|nr:Diacylglycerol kinase [Candidatus Anoxychlamydiales bacterium]NGX40636.1 Diacylglycerol kinase [Candidatus Anoxychlamydiales bacterium]